MTVFALSTDNLNRSKVELDTLMSLIKNSFSKMIENEGFFQKNGVQIKVLGDIKLLTEDVQEVLNRAERLTEENKMVRLNLCICYNSKNEIFEAVDSLSQKYQRKELGEDIKVEDFEKELYGGFNCKPEILIRTSNEIRLSNFLLYQTDES